MTPEECLEEMTAAAGNAQKFVSFLSEDVVCWFSNETAHVGRERVKATLEQSAGLVTDYTYEAGPRQWLVQTDSLAVCLYAFRWSGKVGDRRIEGGGRATRVLRQSNGRWFLVHEHLSKGPLD